MMKLWKFLGKFFSAIPQAALPFMLLAVGVPTIEAQAPQVPVTGNLGSAGSFPLINSPAVVFATDANHTMAYPEFTGSSGFIKVTSTVSLTATRNLVVPLTKGFQWSVENATTGGQSIQVIGASGTGVTIANGLAVLVGSDGTNIVTVGASGGGGGGLSGQTANCAPKATTSTTSTGPMPVCDDGTTTTMSHPTTFTGSGPPISIPASKATAPATGTAQLGTDSSGNLVISENNGAQARVCDATNGVCTGSGGLPSGTGVVKVNSGTGGLAGADTFAPINWGGSATGAVNVLAISLTPAPASIVAGTEAAFLPNLANTSTTPTLNTNGLGAVTIVSNNGGGALAVGDLLTTAVAMVKYDGTHWRLYNPQSTAGGTAVSSINGTPGAFTFSGSVSCSGTACSFGSTFSTTYILLSELSGIHQNTNLNSGGGTSDTVVINNALSIATSSHPVALIQDGASLIDGNGISGPAGGNWAILGLGGGVSDTGNVSGTGFFLATGSTGDAISNGVTPSSGTCGDPNTTPPARGVNTLLKDFVLNYNGPGNAQYCYGIDIQNMEHLVVDDVTVYLASHYSYRIDNVGVSVFHAVKAEPLSPTDTSHPVGNHTDGIHIDGPSNDIAISDSYFHTSDDAIALNAPEGYCGPIQRVTVTNSTAYDSFTMMRAYGAHAVCPNSLVANVDTVNVSNYSGSAYAAAILFGVEGGPYSQTQTGIVTNFTWNNSNILAPYNAVVMENLGTIGLHYDWTPIDGTACTVCGFVTGGATNSTINTLDLSDSNIINPGAVQPMLDTEDPYTYDIASNGTITIPLLITNNVGVKTNTTSQPNATGYLIKGGAHFVPTTHIFTGVSPYFTSIYSTTVPTHVWGGQQGDTTMTNLSVNAPGDSPLNASGFGSIVKLHLTNGTFSTNSDYQVGNGNVSIAYGGSTLLSLAPSGGTLTGSLTLPSGAISVNAPGTASGAAFAFTQSALANGNFTGMVFGRAAALNDATVLLFNSIGIGSASNFGVLGIFGGSDAIHWFPDGHAVFPVSITDTGLTSGNCMQAGTAGILTTVGGPCIFNVGRYTASLGTGTLASGSCGASASSAFAGGTGTSVAAASFSGTDAQTTGALLDNIVLTVAFATDTKVIHATFCNNSGSTWTFTGIGINFLVM